MRPSASNAPSSLAGALALTDAKIGSSGAGVATSESSSTAAASDRAADGSQDGTSGQPFAAALASAQADTDRKPGSQRAAVTAAIEEARGESAASQLTAEARHGTQMSASRAASPIKSNPELAACIAPVTSSGDVAANAQTPMAIAVDSADDAAVTHGGAAKLESRSDGTATSTATRTKSRAGKPLRTTPVLDGAALSALSALLGVAATPTGVTAPATSPPESSAQRTVRNAADAASASAPLSVAANQSLSHGLPAETGAAVATSISPLAVHGPNSGIDTNGASANAFAAARVEGDHNSGTALGSGLAPMLQSLNTVTSTATASPTLSMGVPVAHSSWPNALAAQLQWMATRQVQSATLRLSPEHLGPLEVRIDVMRSQININFTAHHPDTREALAQAVPQLRQLFAAGGLNLGEATVQQEPRSSEQSLPPQPSSATTTSETVEPVANAAIQRLGLVDEYA